jgi:aspartate aminotransferase
MIPLAPRMSRIKPSPSATMSSLARDLIREGHDIIRLSSGEPDFPTPAHVIEAATAAMHRGETKYTAIEGVLELREAIRDKFKRENELDYGTDQIIVGTGSKQVIFDALMATLDAGDEIIVSAPYWVSYPDQAMTAGATPVFVNCSQNAGFKLRPEDLEAAITPRTKWLVINQPNNPSGATYTRDELAALGEVLKRHPHVWVLTDDIYEHLTYDGREFVTIAQVVPELYERTLTVNGVSKAYSMTGWRVGYGAGAPELIKAMKTVQTQATSGTSAITQAAALAALTGPQDFVREQLGAMQERRDVIVELLNQCDGLSCHTPEGAFYVFVNCAGLLGRRTPGGRTIETDGDFAQYILEEAQCTIVQGAGYGMSPYFRVSFPIEVAILREAGRRIRDACAKLE